MKNTEKIASTKLQKNKKNAKENIYEMQNAIFIKIDYEV
jgi:hypothetical protein